MNKPSAILSLKSTDVPPYLLIGWSNWYGCLLSHGYIFRILLTIWCLLKVEKYILSHYNSTFYLKANIPVSFCYFLYRSFIMWKWLMARSFQFQAHQVIDSGNGTCVILLTSVFLSRGMGVIIKQQLRMILPEQNLEKLISWAMHYPTCYSKRCSSCCWRNCFKCID